MTGWIIVGVGIAAFVIGLVLCCFALVIKFYLKASKNQTSNSRNEETELDKVSRVQISVAFSDSSQELAKASGWSNNSKMIKALKTKNPLVGSGVRNYSYKELQKATNGFTTIVGHGAFGTVYRAKIDGGKALAVKVLDINSSEGRKQFLAEILLLGRLHHRNLVNLVGYSTGEGHHMLVYDYMSNGSLAYHLHDKELEPLSWNLRARIALNVARGLEYLHDGAIPAVVHRDIKSSNILLGPSFKAKLADFGLSKLDKMRRRSSDVKGTYGYLDPEYIQTKIYCKKCDIYSFGVLLLELITGRNPQQDLMNYVQFVAMDTDGDIAWELIVDPRLDGKYDVQQLNDIATLAYKCINSASSERPKIRDIVQALLAIAKLRNREKHREPDIPAIRARAGEVIIQVNLPGPDPHLIER